MKDTIFYLKYERWIAEKKQADKGIMIVSDGSYHPQYDISTFTCVITSIKHTNRCLCSDNAVPGDKYL